jgi:small subunit ribosomal protein S20
MANTTSAKKATRKIARRTIINKSRRTQMRGSVRSVEEAIKSGDRAAALKAMARAEPELMQAAQRNIIHKNNASRRSRGSRIRLPSSPNELIEKEIRQIARLAGLFLLYAGLVPQLAMIRIPARPVFLPPYAANGA